MEVPEGRAQPGLLAQLEQLVALVGLVEQVGPELPGQRGQQVEQVVWVQLDSQVRQVLVAGLVEPEAWVALVALEGLAEQEE